MRAVTVVVLVILSAFSYAVEPVLVGDYEVVHKAPIEVYYHPETRAEAEEVLGVLLEAVERFRPNLPPGDAPVRVVIAESLVEFSRFAPGYAHLEVEGVAHSESGWIVVKSRRLHRPDSSFWATLRHELVHVLLARNTAPGNLPRWLNEGIAMMLAGELNWAAPFQVARMYVGGDVIAYSQLDFAFTSATNEQKFGNAYAQARSMTEYLYDSLGEEMFWELVHSLETQSFGKAVQELTGLTPLEFWRAWRQSLWKVALSVSLVSGFTIFQIMAVLTILAYLRKRKQARQKLALWTREEEDDREVFTVWDLEDQDPPHPWEDDED